MDKNKKGYGIYFSLNSGGRKKNELNKVEAHFMKSIMQISRSSGNELKDSNWSLLLLLKLENRYIFTSLMENGKLNQYETIQKN